MLELGLVLGARARAKAEARAWAWARARTRARPRAGAEIKTGLGLRQGLRLGLGLGLELGQGSKLRLGLGLGLALRLRLGLGPGSQQINKKPQENRTQNRKVFFAVLRTTADRPGIFANLSKNAEEHNAKPRRIPRRFVKNGGSSRDLDQSSQKRKRF